MEITVFYKPSSTNEMVLMNKLVEAVMHKFEAKYTGFGRVLPDLECHRTYEIDPTNLESIKAGMKLLSFDVRVDSP